MYVHINMNEYMTEWYIHTLIYAPARITPAFQIISSSVK